MPNGLMTVELEEEPGDDVPEPAVAPTRPRRPRWPWAAGAVLLAAVLAGGQHVVDVRHDAWVARFDSVNGVLPPLPPRLSELRSWRDDNSLFNAVEAGGRAVLLEESHGTVVVRGLDRATGRDAWSHELTVPSHRGTGETPDARCSALTDAHGRADRVACVVALHDGAVAPAAADDVLTASVVVLDGRTGRIVARRQTQEWFWTTAGDLVVTATARTTAGTRTWTLDATTSDGRPAWSRTLAARPVLAPDDDGRLVAIGLSGDAAQVVLSSDGLTTVLDPRGSVARTLSGGRTTSWLPGRTGQLVRVVRTPLDDDPGAYTDVDDVDVPGVTAAPAWLRVDDGSAPDVTLATRDDGSLAAYDRRDGHLLWSAQYGQPGALLLGGRVYFLTTGGLEAHDARTGALVWAMLADDDAETLLTDGRTVYAIAGDALSAYALDDGAVQAGRDAGSDLVETGTRDQLSSIAGLLLRLRLGTDANQSFELTAVG